ncbi:MAG: FAD:protein FMN transferase [bacterium]
MPRSTPPSRRDFFQGGLQNFWNQIADAIDFKEPLAFLGLDRSYVRLRREAMATDFEVLYCNYEKMEVRKTGMRILDEIDRVEAVLTLWKGESELVRVNRLAAREPVPVGPEIFELVKLAQETHQETQGAFDITSTPLSRCWGFFSRQGRVPTQDEIDAARRRMGMEYVELNETERTVFFLKEGIELTPASLGKGLALDYGLRLARQENLTTVLLNGGFSSVLASGAPKWRDAWQIDVRNPLDHQHPLAHLRLRGEGFSSSGAELQKIEVDGQTYGHILDPRTGWPAGEVLNVNVTAPNAARAEALSTAFYVMGVEKTLEYCENHPEIGVLILRKPDEQGRAEIITSNLNPERVEVLLASCQEHRATT